MMQVKVERRVKFIGHLIRHNEFLTDSIEGKVLDKRGRGRTTKSYPEDIYIYTREKQSEDHRSSNQTERIPD